jgi:hypothetical protein
LLPSPAQCRCWGCGPASSVRSDRWSGAWPWGVGYILPLKKGWAAYWGILFSLRRRCEQSSEGTTDQARWRRTRPGRAMERLGAPRRACALGRWLHWCDCPSRSASATADASVVCCDRSYCGQWKGSLAAIVGPALERGSVPPRKVSSGGRVVFLNKPGQGYRPAPQPFRWLGPITRPAWDISGKCKQRTSESKDNCEDDCSIPKHTTPQARSCPPPIP